MRTQKQLRTGSSIAIKFEGSLQRNNRKKESVCWLIHIEGTISKAPLTREKLFVLPVTVRQQLSEAERPEIACNLRWWSSRRSVPVLQKTGAGTPAATMRPLTEEVRCVGCPLFCLIRQRGTPRLRQVEEWI